MKVKMVAGLSMILVIAHFAWAQQDRRAIDVLGELDANWEVARLDAWINEKESREVGLGEKIEFRFKADAVGYVSIAYVDSSGSAAVIVPSINDEPELINAGFEQVYPAPDAGFQFRAIPPAGAEVAFIVLTDRPIRPSSIGEADIYGFLTADSSSNLLERYVSIVNSVARDGLVAVAQITHTSVAPMDVTAGLATADAGEDGPGPEPEVDNDAGADIPASPAEVATAGSDAAPVLNNQPAAGNAAPVERVDESESASQPGFGVATVANEVLNTGDITETISESLQTPDVAVDVDLPEVPTGDDIAEASGIAGVNEAVTEATTMPTVRVMDDIDVPDAGAVLDATPVAAVGENIDIPQLPTGSTMPTTSEVLTASGLPDVSNPPGVGSLPSLPGAPATPTVSDMVDVPDVPGVDDIVTVPDVPKATDIVELPNVSVPQTPDVSGNVLGRVVSQVQSIPTSSSALESTGKQIATATVARKVFNMAFGGRGNGGAAKPAGAPIGVQGVIDKLESDPTQLDELAAESPGAIGAARLLSRSSDPDMELALTMQELEATVEKNSEVYYCTDVSDCAAMPMGKNACGHARKFVIYTKTTTDVDGLTASVRDFNNYDTVKRLADNEVAENCATAAPTPELICARNICDVAGQSE